jgi:hypothetical protein
MEEGDCGDIGGAAAPAREVGAPTRRADLSGELRKFIALDSGRVVELLIWCVLCYYY